MNTAREDGHHFEGRIYVQPKKALEVKKRIPVKKVNVVKIERVPILPNAPRTRSVNGFYNEVPLTIYQSLAIDLVKKLVCEQYGVTAEQLECKSRVRPFVIPRHIAMYICDELQLGTLKGIGSKFGGRDHSTVINAKQKINDELFCDKTDRFKFAIKEMIDTLEEKIKKLKEVNDLDSNNIAQL